MKNIDILILLQVTLGVTASYELCECTAGICRIYDAVCYSFRDL